MPAFSHGKNTKVSVDNAAGVLTDISNVTNSITMPRNTDTGETSAFGQNDKSYINGQQDGTVSIGGLFDPTVDAQLSAIVQGQLDGTILSSTVEYGPQGGATGKIKFTCEVIWTGYSVEAGVGDVLTFKLDGQRTGPTARGTF
ncbi:hypothetical protein SEA_WHEELBITE_61 [Arthrobacter phage Wheelbite]|uniref:Major tail protein n=1 Tax=Arthrobacter phage Wheelbite TaxID=2015873 RepID=A0A222ZIZ4_9CAUD|nr:major tail protein [Arthrobacter phage Wheelbite]ASR84151.1 hypothetical protein SEA_WHEELBITE_61 [Arthrobacter phage Wheelbite]